MILQNIFNSGIIVRHPRVQQRTRHKMSSIERAEGMWIMSYFCAGVNLLSILFLLVFAVCIDLPRRGIPVAMNTVFSVSQTLLASLHLSTMFYQIFKGLFRQLECQSYRIASAFSYGVSAVLYLFFSWARSSDILKNQYTPRMYRIYLTLLYFTPLTCMLPTMVKFCTLPLPVVESEMYFNISQIVSGTFLTAMDAFFAIAFYSYLNKYTNSVDENAIYGNSNGQKLKTIALYGLISSWLCFVTLLAFASVMTAFFMDPNLESPTLWMVYQLGQMVADVGSTAAVFSPVVMKVRLHQIGIQNLQNSTCGSKNAAVQVADGETVGTVRKTFMSTKRLHTNPSWLDHD
ncbi:hypothetical protein BJ741DRAFT_648409 [Chytriomyces cf. hyalinus JEL632]|nr:hypothetical protein BJ741DRAFT_648409 [Chytriomyces cf. hyalinus JEL632]